MCIDAEVLCYVLLDGTVHWLAVHYLNNTWWLLAYLEFVNLTYVGIENRLLVLCTMLSWLLFSAHLV
jgi:hypothetical protein